MNKTYSHAAPFIREALVRAVWNGKKAKLQRDRAKYFGEAYAYAQSLNIMRLAGDQTPAPGIHRLETIAPGGDPLSATREFLGGSADEILGTDEQIRQAQAEQEAGA